MNNSAMLTIRTDKKVKHEAQKITKALGLSLSAVVNGYLKELTRTKKIEFSMEAMPNADLITRLAKINSPVQTAKSAKARYLDPKYFRRLVWEYKIAPKEFFDILEGKKEKGWFTQDWAIARVLQNLNYYDARDLVPLSVLQNHWPVVKPKLFQESLRRNYEFVLHQYAVSTARQSITTD